ncbi:MAG: FAD-binding protein, partial [Nitrospinota bacterium]
METRSDFLVMGSGIAGLSFALKACKYGSVVIVTKRSCEESSTKYAQGGIASVMAEDDSYDLHIKDTIEAGAGLCHEDAVRLVVENGPDRIRELIELGAKFTLRDEDVLDLGREGGHSKRRIVHATDFTGEEIEGALIEAVKKNNNIRIYENHIAIDLITKSRLESDIESGGKDDMVLGAYVLDKNKGEVKSFLSKITLLATGGAGKVYLYT